MKKIVVKSEAVFAKEGIPRFLTSFLIEMEDRVNEMYGDKAFKKSASPTNAKSLNAMKQGVKKWLSTNTDQAARVKAFRENPKLAEEEDVKPVMAKKSGAKSGAREGLPANTNNTSSSHGWSVNKDDASPVVKPAKLVGRAKWIKRHDEDDSSDDDENDTSWLDEDDEDDGGDDALVAGIANRKKPEGKDSKRNAKPKSSSSKLPVGDVSDDDDVVVDSDAESKKSELEDKQAKEKEKQKEWNAEKIDLRLKELIARRGTRNYDRVKQVTLFVFLLERTKEKANTPERTLRILFALVDSLFDVNQNMYMHMNVKIWKYAYNAIVKIFELIAANAGKVEVVETEPVIKSSKDALNVAIEDQGVIQVRGLILSTLERLDEEYFRSLQIMDPHTQDYVARMRHESSLLKLLKLGFDYFESHGETQKAASLAARRLDHLYYRKETEGASQRAALREAQRQMASDIQEAQMARDWKKNDDALLRESGDSTISSSTEVDPNNPDAANLLNTNPLNEIPDEDLNSPSAIADETNLVELVPSLASLVYKSNDERLRIRAVLQHIYHLALHDKYFEARDRMLATRMQEEIVNASDPSMHVLFNRSLVQLGLGAFRKGRVGDAHSALAEIVGPRLKELLAQGLVINRNVDKTAEQEKLERRRQMPYPMHINIDLIEFVHLTSAMLLEVPNMAASAFDSRKRPLSKTFRKTMENSERSAFTGPPENTKDHVIAASKALIQSDWQLCSSLLLNLDIWKLIPKADDVKIMLKKKIQEEALRTHLFSNAQFYETIKLEQLITLFQLPKHSVHALASKMMIHDELPGASWDQPSESIILSSQSSSHTSHLHILSLQYADRISNLFDNSDNDGERGSGQGGGSRYQDRSSSGQQGGQGGSGGQGREGGHHHHHGHSNHHHHHQDGGGRSGQGGQRRDRDGGRNDRSGGGGAGGSGGGSYKSGGGGGGNKDYRDNKSGGAKYSGSKSQPAKRRN
jgi:translation initiation factor 3 subunit C